MSDSKIVISEQQIPLLFKRYKEEVQQAKELGPDSAEGKQHTKNAEKIKALLMDYQRVKKLPSSYYASIVGESSGAASPASSGTAGSSSDVVDDKEKTQELLRKNLSKFAQVRDSHNEVLAKLEDVKKYLAKPQVLTPETKAKLLRNQTVYQLEEERLKNQVLEISKTVLQLHLALKGETAQPLVAARPMGLVSTPSVYQSTAPAAPQFSRFGYQPPFSSNRVFLGSYNSAVPIYSKQQLMNYLRQTTFEESLLVSRVPAGNKVIMDSDFENLLNDLIKEFLDLVVEFSGKLARHRHDSQIVLKDMKVNLERNWGIVANGAGEELSSLEIKALRKRKFNLTESYVNKLRKVYEAKKEE